MLAVKYGLGRTIDEIGPADLSSVHKAGKDASRRGILTDTLFSVTMQVTSCSL